MLWTLSASAQDISRSINLNPCLATRDRDAFFLIPTSVFGTLEQKRINLVFSSHQTGFQAASSVPAEQPGIMIKGTVRQTEGSTIDRMPDKGELSLIAE